MLSISLSSWVPQSTHIGPCTWSAAFRVAPNFRSFWFQKWIPYGRKRMCGHKVCIADDSVLELTAVSLALDRTHSSLAPKQKLSHGTNVGDKHNWNVADNHTQNSRSHFKWRHNFRPRSCWKLKSEQWQHWPKWQFAAKHYCRCCCPWRERCCCCSPTTMLLLLTLAR